MTLEQIIQERNKYDPNSFDWYKLNIKKAELLEQLKPSTKETILFFNEEDLDCIPEGFTHSSIIPNIPCYYDRRSFLEYNPTQRHPIPYCIIKHKDKYFFILRESGSGELRLIGKKGLVGGHVSIENKCPYLDRTIEDSMLRELKEETGITLDIINRIELKGFIKINDTDVDKDHLGLVFVIEVSTDDIKSEESGILSGIWIEKNNLINHYKSFENWSKIVFDNLLKY